MQSGIAAAIEPTRVKEALVITGNFEPKVDKPLAIKVDKLLAMKMDKLAVIKGLFHFEAASAADDSDNPPDDPDAATGDPADLWADFYNLLYTFFASRNHGDWSALLSNTPIVSQPPADIAPVDTPIGDRSLNALVVDTASPLVVDTASPQALKPRYEPAIV